MSTASANGHADRAARLTTGLGWFSLGLGTSQLVAPEVVNKAIGVHDDARSRGVQRAVGMQELCAAAGIFAQRRPVSVLWGRTAADVVHLGMLGHARASRRNSRPRVAAAIASVIGTFAADAFAAAGMSRNSHTTRKGTLMKSVASVTVRADRDELARRWRAFGEGDGQSRLGPLAMASDDPGGAIAWETTERSAAKGSGVTRFVPAPPGRGVEVHVSFEFGVPGGTIGQTVKKVTGDDPEQLVRDDLRRFKQLVETGEVVRSQGTPEGHTAENQPKQRPAQPLEHTTA